MDNGCSFNPSLGVLEQMGILMGTITRQENSRGFQSHVCLPITPSPCVCLCGFFFFRGRRQSMFHLKGAYKLARQKMVGSQPRKVNQAQRTEGTGIGEGGRSVRLQAARGGKPGEARRVLPAPAGPDKASLGPPAHPAGFLWPVANHQGMCLPVLYSPRLPPFAYVAALGSWQPGSQTSVFGSGPWPLLFTQPPNTSSWASACQWDRN